MTESVAFEDLEDLTLEHLEAEDALAIFAVDEEGNWLETTALSTDSPCPVTQ